MTQRPGSGHLLKASQSLEVQPNLPSQTVIEPIAIFEFREASFAPILGEARTGNHGVGVPIAFLRLPRSHLAPPPRGIVGWSRQSAAPKVSSSPDCSRAHRAVTRAPRKIHPCRSYAKCFQRLSDRREQLSWYFSRCPPVIGGASPGRKERHLSTQRCSWTLNVILS